MAKARNDLGERFECLDAIDTGETAAHYNVFVGECHEGTVIGLGHETLENGITLCSALDGHQTNKHAWCATDALESGEGDTVQLAVETCQCAEHPVGLRLSELSSTK